MVQSLMFIITNNFLFPFIIFAFCVKIWLQILNIAIIILKHINNHLNKQFRLSVKMKYET